MRQNGGFSHFSRDIKTKQQRSRKFKNTKEKAIKQRVSKYNRDKMID
jgi:hypothetical protein